MTNKQKILRRFLSLIFSVVGSNSPYNLMDFVNILINASNDFVNNTCTKTNFGPIDGQTVFNRLLGCDHEEIESAFLIVLCKFLSKIRCILRNRKVALAFDITYEPFYGDINKNPFWIHDYRPVRGCYGCFQFLVVAVVIGKKRFILGSLPVPRGRNLANMVEKLLVQARKFVPVEACLFDRGFCDYRIIQRLKNRLVGYQILWTKAGRGKTWTKKELKSMKPGQIKEVIREVKYKENKSGHRIKVRFVLIKQYRLKGENKAYDWIFATNLKLKSQIWYIRKYKKRWGIETCNRVCDQVRIKTTTLDEVKRFFLFTFGCLLYNLWKFANLFLEKRITFLTFTYFLIKIIEQKSVQKKRKPGWDELKEILTQKQII